MTDYKVKRQVDAEELVFLIELERFIGKNSNKVEKYITEGRKKKVLSGEDR